MNNQKSVTKHAVKLHTVMLAILTFSVGATLTLLSVDRGVAIPEFSEITSPRGYTWSLTLSGIPVIVLFTWFYRKRKKIRIAWTPFWMTVIPLVIIWTGLDVLAAPSLFQFPNCSATLERYFAGWVPGEGFTGLVPIEEIIFYLAGCINVLLTYIWADHSLFKRANNPIENLDVPNLVPLIKFDPRVMWFAIGLLGFAFIYRFYIFDGNFPQYPPYLEGCIVQVPNTEGTGFPLYLTLLFALAFLPAILLWNKTWEYVNPAALFFCVVTLMFASLLWEVTLALPYGWWNYNPKWMMGIFIAPWYNLPIEAVVLWFIAGWGIVLIYEFFKVLVATNLPYFDAAFKKYGQMEKLSDE